MGHVFGSEWLPTQLNHYGYFSCYKDIQRCKQSAVNNESPLDTGRNGTFSHDKVDQDVRTLDGRRILNAMEMVSATVGIVKAIRNKLPAISREQFRNVTVTMSVKIFLFHVTQMKN